MSNQNQKRGRNRNQGGGGGGRRGGGGNPARQNYDSNGPGVRIRGNASQIYDKYLQLARDAQSSSDRVLAENMLQHAEHYYRILNADSAGDRGGRQGQPQSPNASDMQGDRNQADDAGNRDPNSGGGVWGNDGGDDNESGDGANNGSANNGGGNGGRNGRGGGQRGPRNARGRGRGRNGGDNADSSDNADSGADNAADGEVGNGGEETSSESKPRRGRPPRKPRGDGDGKSARDDSGDADDAGLRAIIGAD